MGLVGQLASLRIERGSGYTQEQLDDRNRQVEWERGQIDYMGIDSFSNIQVPVCSTHFQTVTRAIEFVLNVSRSQSNVLRWDKVGFDSLHSMWSNLSPLFEDDYS